MWKGLYMGLQSGRQARMQKEAVEEENKRWEAEMDLRERQFAAQQAARASAGARAAAEAEAEQLKALSEMLEGGGGSTRSSGGSGGGGAEDVSDSSTFELDSYLKTQDTSGVDLRVEQLAQDPHRAEAFMAHVDSYTDHIGRTPTPAEALSTFSYSSNPAYAEAIKTNNSIRVSIRGLMEEYQSGNMEFEDFIKEANTRASAIVDLPVQGGSFSSFGLSPEDTRKTQEDEAEKFEVNLTDVIYSYGLDQTLTKPGGSVITVDALIDGIDSGNRALIRQLPYMVGPDGVPLGEKVAGALISSGEITDLNNPRIPFLRRINTGGVPEETPDALGGPVPTQEELLSGTNDFSVPSVDEGVSEGLLTVDESGTVTATDPSLSVYTNPETGEVYLYKKEEQLEPVNTVAGGRDTGTFLSEPGKLFDRLELEKERYASDNPDLDIGFNETVQTRNGVLLTNIEASDLSPDEAMMMGIDRRSTTDSLVLNPGNDLSPGAYKTGTRIAYRGNVWEAQDRVMEREDGSRYTYKDWMWVEPVSQPEVMSEVGGMETPSEGQTPFVGRGQDSAVTQGTAPEMSVPVVLEGGPIRDVRDITYSDWATMTRGERGELGLPLSVLGGEIAFNRFMSGITGRENTVPVDGINKGSGASPTQPLPPSDGVTNLRRPSGFEGDIVDQRTPGSMPLRDSADAVPAVGGPTEPTIPTAFTRLQTSLVTLLGSDSQAVRELPRLLSETDGPRAARNVATIIREVSALPRSSTRDKTLEVLFGLRDRLNRR